MESSEPLNVDGNPTRGFIEARARTTDTDGTIKVEDVTIGQTIFINRGTGAVDVLPTRLFNSGKFNRQAYKGITMRGNGFDGSVLPQANPCTVNAPFTNVNNTGTNGDVDFGNKLPFGARPMAVVSIQPQIKPGSQGGAYETPAVLSISANIVNIGMSAQWSGDCLVTVTGNIESVSGNTFIDG